MALLVASCASDRERALIAKGDVWHYSKATTAQLVVSKLHHGPGEPNAIIRLSPPNGWQFNFWKFIRDFSVWDRRFHDAENFGRYLYLFRGKPGWFTRVTNVQNAPVEIRIAGSAVLSAIEPGNLFYRDIDNVVVIKGDFVGPAELTPAP